MPVSYYRTDTCTGFKIPSLDVEDIIHASRPCDFPVFRQHTRLQQSVCRALDTASTVVFSITIMTAMPRKLDHRHPSNTQIKPDILKKDSIPFQALIIRISITAKMHSAFWSNYTNVFVILTISCAVSYDSDIPKLNTKGIFKHRTRASISPFLVRENAKLHDVRNSTIVLDCPAMSNTLRANTLVRALLLAMQLGILISKSAQVTRIWVLGMTLHILL
ncbi:hypothetical protein BDU57DRAFT_530429 [Ampelomyces quisqualis]|uniref:Uncharacterized protein n=1 Tax=Ampelomyces quisqualis TaxID=50730 RepID=A0A6A5QLU4_AMPQU|nr:hypothetical protein BDU57DRAFT_530429 [Ampelomyces quisqualis]